MAKDANTTVTKKTSVTLETTDSKPELGEVKKMEEKIKNKVPSGLKIGKCKLMIIFQFNY